SLEFMSSVGNRAAIRSEDGDWPGARLCSGAAPRRWAPLARPPRRRGYRMRCRPHPGAEITCGRIPSSHSSVIVFPPNDVVLTEVEAVLDLDDRHRHLAGVLDAVPCAPGHADHLFGPQPKRPARHEHPGRSVTTTQLSSRKRWRWRLSRCPGSTSSRLT